MGLATAARIIYANVGPLLTGAGPPSWAVDAQAVAGHTGLEDQPLGAQVGNAGAVGRNWPVIRNLVAVSVSWGAGLKLGQRYHLTSLACSLTRMFGHRTLNGKPSRSTSQFRPLAVSICNQPGAGQGGTNWDGTGMIKVLPEDWARCLVVERGHGRPGKGVPNARIIAATPFVLWRFELRLQQARAPPESWYAAILAGRG